MPILPDGRIQIRNAATGETKIINPEEASMYGISADLIKNAQQAKPFIPQSSIPTTKSTLPDIGTTNRPPLGTFAKKTGEEPSVESQMTELLKRKAADILANPEKRQEIADYYDAEIKALDPMGARAKREQAISKLTGSGVTLEGVGQLENYFGSAGGGGEKNPGLMGVLKNVMLTGAGVLRTNEDARTFNQKRDALIATLKGITGDTGVLTEQDAKRLVGLIPDLGTSNEQAAKQFQEIRNLLAAKFGGDAGTTTVTSKPSTIQNQPATLPDIKVGFGEDKSKDAFQYLQEADKLAKQSLTETDPAKKQALLDKSRTLSEVGSQMSQTQKINPITYGAGKTQEFLGNSEALPAIGGSIGAFAGPGASAVGAAEGEYLKKFLQKTEKGGEKVLTLPDVGGIGLKAAEYYAIGKIFNMGGKYIKNALDAKTLNPSKISLFLREKAAEATPTIDTSGIIKAGERWAKLDPQSSAIWNELKAGITPEMKTKDLLDLLTAWGSRTWTLSGDVKDKAAAQLMKHIYGAGREVIQTQAPEVAAHTAELAKLMNAPQMLKGAQKASWLLLKLLGIGKLL